MTIEFQFPHMGLTPAEASKVEGFAPHLDRLLHENGCLDRVGWSGFVEADGTRKIMLRRVAMPCNHFEIDAERFSGIGYAELFNEIQTALF